MRRGTRTSAETVAKTIYGRLDEIQRSQSDTAVSKQQHIAYFRENGKVLDNVLLDVEELEKILVAVGGADNIRHRP